MTFAVVDKGILGAFTSGPQGVRFLPWTDAHKPSRRAWPSAAEALPRWARAMGARIVEAESAKSVLEALKAGRA